MKILFFTHEKELGGASKALITLINDLKKNNEIFVVTPFNDSKIIFELKDSNVKFISCFFSWWQVPTNISVIKKCLFKIAYLFNTISIIRLKKIIRNLDIDIIHSNTSVIDIGAIIARKLHIPHVWHFREFTGKHLSYIKGEKKSYQFINDSKSSIIYISKAIQHFYEKNINKKFGHLIYDGVPNNYSLSKKYNKKNEIIFLQVATLEKNKGQDVAIRAVNILKKEGYKNFKLLLAGGNPTNYWNELKNNIKKYNIDDIVEYIGFVNDMNNLRAKVDVELMCAPKEAFGLVTIEGMMAGNPVIGSNSGATSELIINGENGYLYELNNEKDLANKMKFFLDNYYQIEKMGAKASKYAIKNFSSKNNTLSTIKLYQEILKRVKI